MRCSSLKFDFRNVANLHLISEMLQIYSSLQNYCNYIFSDDFYSTYFWLKSSCNFMFGFRDITISFLVMIFIQFFLLLHRCCNFIFAYRDIAIFPLLKDVAILCLVTGMCRFIFRYKDVAVFFHFFTEMVHFFLFFFCDRIVVLSFLVREFLRFYLWW